MTPKIRVCVVDDHVESTKVLCEGLEMHDYEALPAHTGGEALDICASESIDLILLDIGLPDMDGYEVCKRLKESPNTRDIAVIFVTIKGEAEDISRGYQLGATDYIAKPYSLPMVMVRLDAVVRNKWIHDEIRAADDDATATAYTDYLTGLRNRAYLTERLQEEVDKAHRYDVPLSCIVFDVDEITALDDESGPASIDDLLAEISMGFNTASRNYDILARYDGTLFAAVLPHTPLEQALQYVDKILDDVDATTFSDPNFPTKISMSVGAVSCRNGTAKSADTIFGEAMRSLLEAKSQPGKRVIGRSLVDAAKAV